MSFRKQVFWLLLAVIGSIPMASAQEWQTIFNGTSLEGWDGDPELWRVENGAITGETTAEKKIDQTHF